MPSVPSSLKDDLLKSSRWSLAAARAHAQHLLARRDQRRAAREIVTVLSTNIPNQRVRAADVARRITDHNPAFLAAHASEIAAILAETPITESRTRWHLGLVVARTARTPSQIRLATGLLWQLSQDKSNVVRCAAVEGLGLLARRDPSLGSTVEPYLEQAFAAGTPAMRVRARNALRCLHSKPSRPRPSSATKRAPY